MSRRAAATVCLLLLAATSFGQSRCPGANGNFSRCIADSRPSEAGKRFNFPSWAADRVGGFANDAPITRGLHALSAAQRASVRAAVSWMRDNANSVHSTRRSECNQRSHMWTDRVHNAMMFRMLPKLNHTCTVSRDHSDSESLDAVQVFRRVATAIAAAGQGAAQRRWNLPAHRVAKWRYEARERQQNCTVDRLTAIRLKGVWFIQGLVTSTVVDRSVGTAERKLLEEYVHEDLCCPLTSWFRRPRNKTEEPTGFSTIFMNWEGGVDLSAFYKMPFDDNAALSTALAASDMSVELAEDALRPANVAILLVPLAMSFVPIALIADVNGFAAFMYILFTDFFASVPLVIKGVELVITGSNFRTAASTWLVGDSSLLVSEAWAASCKPLTRYRHFGIGFIVIGLAAMLTGFALEMTARKYIHKRRMQGDDPRPFGAVMLGSARGPNASVDEPNYMADFPMPPPRPLSVLYRRIVRRRQEPAAHMTASYDVTPGKSVGAIEGTPARFARHTNEGMAPPH